MFGGLIGGALSLAGGMFGSKQEKKAAKQGMMGFNYLKDNELIKETQSMGLDAMNMRGALLGLGGDEDAAMDAFNQYKDSAGYQFQMDQGTSAITQSRAAKGILNSGATSKELTKFGQGLGASYFKDFMGMLGSEADAGLTATGQVADAAQTAGDRAAEGTRNAAQQKASGIGGLVSGIGSIFGF